MYVSATQQEKTRGKGKAKRKREEKAREGLARAIGKEIRNIKHTRERRGRGRERGAGESGR